uniref:Tryptophan-rich sensory protein n=1 Tax=Pseudo-nitzschia australis TaxID=44445 RepID=A0A7S4EIJ3_9STRA|eukprot:CAMPEP_0168174306 /NCGR_PEP_ID=MMETSP0139_2-20121125/6419_1 /TAXON_ID=44445 /ORGANISM="Pseudo-nitzschia australis, Strain 10249 10 AB" /LENGTH=290 /DNA_ID=CAMNT_0008092419 /DNA_START=93 /DNA_END=965 /DNA_ORIENTATION=-
MTSSVDDNTQLKTINYVNVIAYLSNFLVVFGSSRAGLPDNGTMSERYQTLVTPAGYAFSIWGIIFTAELIWTIVQLFPAYRSNEIVVKSVGYNFALACLAQGSWTIFFGFEKIALSLVAMICILIPLVFILLDLSRTSSATYGEYWLLKFPFLIHAAWIMAATLVNINVVVVAYKASPVLQTIFGWASLVTVFFVGTYFTTTVWRESKRVWVVPCVLVWAAVAIASELSKPKDIILATFSESAIEQTKGASGIVAILLLLVTVIEFIRSQLSTNENQTGANNNAQYTSLS